MLLKDGILRIYVTKKFSRCKLFNSFSILSNSKRESLFNVNTIKRKFTLLAPAVQKVDSAIHRINLYPVDNAVGFPNTYPLDSDLFG